MEGIISTHPAVKSAIIGGHGEFQAALLVEPKVHPATAKERQQLLQDIWPTIVQANRDCPAHGRIMKDFVLFTSSEKPMPRAGKDTVQRYATLKLYADDFKALFARLRSTLGLPNHDSNGVSNEILKRPLTKIRHGTSDVSDTSPGTAACTSLPTHGATHSADGLDARIEAALYRILPNALLKHFEPILAKVVVDSFHLSISSNNMSNPANKPRPEISDYVDDKELDEPDSATGAGAPTGHSQCNLQTQEPLLQIHHNGTDRAVSSSETAVISIPNTSESLRDSLYRIIQSVTYLHGLEDAANLFDCGLGSLQVPVLVEEINKFLTKTRPDIRLLSTKEIYANRSIKKLLAALCWKAIGLTESRAMHGTAGISAQHLSLYIKAFFHRIA